MDLQTAAQNRAQKDEKTMTNEKKQLLGHSMACATQIMWGATFVSTKVLLQFFQPAQVLFIRAVLAFCALSLVYPHRLRLEAKKQELAFAGAGLTGLVLYFMLENTALTLTYAANVGIIVACAPFFVAVVVSIFFRSERPKRSFFIGFVIAMAGIVLISMSGQKSFHLNPAGDFLALLAMISWGFYSALVKKIEEWNYPVIAVTRRIYFYGMLFMLPVLLWQGASWEMDVFQKSVVWANFLFLGLCASALGFLTWNLSVKWIGALKTSVYIYVSPIVTVVLSVLVLHEKMTLVSVIGAALILTGLLISQRKA